MLTPAYVNLVTFFYPLGNTPAISLTQGLPVEKRADILLLGCGDVRHVLFTAHTNGTQRLLDITCCDVETAIIARNILLLSLVIDDVEGSRDEHHWNLYYHLRIDRQSLKLLRSQAQKLCLSSASLQLWHKSTYGNRLRICDNRSLEKLRALWNLYGTERNELDSVWLATRLEESLKKSEQFKTMLGSGMNLTGFRSASPTHLQALENLDFLHKYYWKHGSTLMEQEALAAAIHPNPMFLSSNDNLILHYGTDPLLGFHLATAYVSLEPSSVIPADVSKPVAPTPEDVVKAAKAEFRDWSSSFREVSPNITLRFIVSDALALSHCFQHRRNGTMSCPTHWYSDRFHYEPLSLSVEDYGQGGAGPLVFDVIDTSNLIDHVGALNLLTATSPLLANSSSATLYIERLVQSEQTVNSLLSEALCGDPPTISLLFGLVPVDFVTNTSATSTGDEIILHAATRYANDKAIRQTQCFVRIAWKRPLNYCAVSDPLRPQQPISIDPVGLANILYRMYLKMFEIEDMAQMMSGLTLTRLQKLSLPKYQRASFAALLYFVKTRTLADWETTMKVMLDSIETNSSHMMGRHYIQELYVWLHLLELFTVPTFREPFKECRDGNQQADLRSWKNMPPLVCVTLEIPRPKLEVFTKIDILKLGTPPVHGLVQAPINSPRKWQNLFTALQFGFGTIKSKGVRYTDSFEPDVFEDSAGWFGGSPLLVSFYVPTWVLLLEPLTAIVAFGVQSTPQTASTFMSSLGVHMNVYQTVLADEKHVYISKTLPNHLGISPVCCSGSTITSLPQIQKVATNTTMTARVNVADSKISSLTGRVSLLSCGDQATLRKGLPVSWTAKTPFNIVIRLDERTSFDLNYPAPVLVGSIKTRIARKSSYVELDAQLASERDWPTLPFTYLMVPQTGPPECWNMPYVDIEGLPVVALNRKPQWLNPHISMMFSKQELLLRQNTSLSASTTERTKLELKDSLFSLFTLFTGLKGPQTRIFGISCPDNGGIHIILLVSSLRLELMNRTVMLDAVALPLHDALMPQLHHFLQALTNNGSLCQIKASKEEMRLWKLMLPAWIERCRSWPHRISCEYSNSGQIPLSFENGAQWLCSCAEGQLPTNLVRNVPRWHEAEKYAVRVAISPMFPAAPFDFKDHVGSHNKNLDMTMSTDRSRCMNCGRDGSWDGSGLQKCGRCRQAKYCSQECQRACWQTHKKVCRRSD